MKYSKFHLIDLAQSEIQKQAGTNQERFKEGVKINASLFKQQ